MATRPSVTDLRRYALQRGMVGLREDGLRKMKRGITTIEEVLRATEDAGPAAPGAADAPADAQTEGNTP